MGGGHGTKNIIAVLRGIFTAPSWRFLAHFRVLREPANSWHIYVHFRIVFSVWSSYKWKLCSRPVGGLTCSKQVIASGEFAKSSSVEINNL